jgi:mono/diheme cytochrome c family protein
MLMAVGASLGFAAILACAGGEAGEQQVAESQMAETSQPAENQSAQEVELPEGVTMEMVNKGRELFTGAGLCNVCHGDKGEGGIGANLNDEEWLHGDGSYEGIVETVTNGVDSSKSTNGTPMAQKGGSGITDDQVKEVVAYVYYLSKGGM